MDKFLYPISVITKLFPLDRYFFLRENFIFAPKLLCYFQLIQCIGTTTQLLTMTQQGTMTPKKTQTEPELNGRPMLLNLGLLLNLLIALLCGRRVCFKTVLLLGVLISMTSCFRDSPDEVVEEFLELSNDAEYSEAEDLMSNELKEALKAKPEIGGIKGFCDYSSRNGTLSDVEIESVEERGEGATVKATLYLENGATVDDETHLREEDGEWKIAP